MFDRLKKIEEHIDALRIIEHRFLTLQAHEKVLYAKLYLGAQGSNVEERKCRVHSSQDWVDFVDGLAEVESAYLEAKRRMELKFKAMDAEYLEVKTDAQAIIKFRGIT